MKTFKLALLVSGLLLVSSGYAYTIFNLPGEIIINPIDKLKISDEAILTLDITNSGAKNSVEEVGSSDDTIIINLAEVVITSEFPASARECISRQVPYPNFAQRQKLEGGVALSFSFDRSGIITINEVYSSNPQLENYVKDCIQNLQLDYCRVDIGKEYYLRFLFKLR
ncbi:MAG: hypothetical protein K8S16_18865 [Bacteroidales bacterium]|nr:hypothetical protein [Bacteroidales bacterium]